MASDSGLRIRRLGVRVPPSAPYFADEGAGHKVVSGRRELLTRRKGVGERGGIPGTSGHVRPRRPVAERLLPSDAEADGRWSSSRSQAWFAATPRRRWRKSSRLGCRSSRLNDHHADQLLDVARTFGGEPDAVSARAMSLDDDGVDLVIETADSRQPTVRIQFAAAVSGARRRLVFRELAQQAADRLRRDRSEAAAP
jgi:Domain of unknown function (DUF2470)